MADDSSKKYNTVLEIIEKRLIPDQEAKKARGEVFTPLTLVRQMLYGVKKSSVGKGPKPIIWGFDEKTGEFSDDDEKDRLGGIPLEMFRNAKSTWLDPANGIGNFPVVAFYMIDYQLGKHGNDPSLKGSKNTVKRRKHIVEKMLYMIELNKGNVNTARKVFKLIAPDATSNICCANTLLMTDAKLQSTFGTNRFDVIMGNPPFNSNGTMKGGGALWPNFVKLAFKLVEQDGYIMYIHPPGWRKFYDAEDRDNQGKLWHTIQENGWTLDYINVSDQSPEHFPIVDYYIIHAKATHNKTRYSSTFMGIIDSGSIPLNYPFIPSMINDDTMNILDKLFKAKGKPIHIIYNQSFKPSSKNEGDKGIPHYHFVSRDGAKKYYNKKYDSVPDYIEKDKVVMTYGSGCDKGRLFAFYSDTPLGTTNQSMYMLSDSKAHGEKLVRFFNSDIITFLLKITQYTPPPNHKNEFKILNQLQMPESLDYHLTDTEKELINKVVNAKKQEKQTRSNKKKQNGSARFQKTRKQRKN